MKSFLKILFRAQENAQQVVALRAENQALLSKLSLEIQKAETLSKTLRSTNGRLGQAVRARKEEAGRAQALFDNKCKIISKNTELQSEVFRLAALAKRLENSLKVEKIDFQEMVAERRRDVANAQRERDALREKLSDFTGKMAQAIRVISCLEKDGSTSGIWSAWHPYGGGKCPIPWAISGDYGLEYEGGIIPLVDFKPATDWDWDCVSRYRYRLSSAPNNITRLPKTSVA